MAAVAPSKYPLPEANDDDHDDDDGVDHDDGDDDDDHADDDRDFNQSGCITPSAIWKL